jgi:hypothetical protein
MIGRPSIASSVSPGVAIVRLMKSCSGFSGNLKTITSPRLGGRRVHRRLSVHGTSGP